MTQHDQNRTVRILAASLLAGAISLSGAVIASDANPDEPKAKGESEQPMGDTWITTKVKADLLTTEDVSGLDISVETVNGVVHLSGDVPTKAEADRAISVAQGIEGVVRVDSSALKVAGAAAGDQ